MKLQGILASHSSYHVNIIDVACGNETLVINEFLNFLAIIIVVAR